MEQEEFNLKKEKKKDFPPQAWCLCMVGTHPTSITSFLRNCNTVLQIARQKRKQSNSESDVPKKRAFYPIIGRWFKRFIPLFTCTIQQVLARGRWGMYSKHRARFQENAFKRSGQDIAHLVSTRKYTHRTQIQVRLSPCSYWLGRGFKTQLAFSLLQNRLGMGPHRFLSLVQVQH